MDAKNMILLVLLGVFTSGYADDMSVDMQRFYQQLSPVGQERFMQLDAAHRNMAMETTKQELQTEKDPKCAREKAVAEQYYLQQQK